MNEGKNERDRYQIYDARPKSHFVVQDTGLGIARTNKAVIITVVSKERPEILKRRLYKEMTEELARSASIAPSDVMICVIENSAADWTFGNGDPQFLSGIGLRAVTADIEESYRHVVSVERGGSTIDCSLHRVTPGR